MEMTPEALNQLTSMLGRPPHAEYLELLSNYPPRLRAARRAIDDTTSEGVVADVELIIAPESIVALNLEARRDCLTDPEGVEYVWPDQLLVIGETGAGDYYCLDVDAKTTEVIQYDHQAVQWEVVADSLDEFVEILVDTFCADEPNLDGRVDDED